MNIDLTAEQKEKLTREFLVDVLEELEVDVETGWDDVKVSLKTLIAYFSVPGTYKDGKYDRPI